MAQQRKTILVTGGAGFIGSALVKQLQTLGHTVYVIDNLSFGSREYLTISDSCFYKVDILDAPTLNSMIRAIDPQWIIHLAAIHFIPYCNQHPVEASRINIQGTINVLNAARQLQNLEKMFFASTAAVYPICDYAIPETHPLEPTDIYGLSKLAGEHLMSEFHLQTSIPTIIGRFFNAFGPHETNPHVIPEIQHQINSGIRVLKLGNLEPKRDFIHTSDMAIAMSQLLDRFTSGCEAFNIGGGQEYSVKDVIQAFEAELGERISVQTDPTRLRKVERMHLLADITKLKQFIYWEPSIKLSEGIKTLIKVQSKVSISD